MKLQGVPPEFKVERDDEKCIRCKVCENQCTFEVHRYNEEDDILDEDEYFCCGCHRCETLCPTDALKIKRHK